MRHWPIAARIYNVSLMLGSGFVLALYFPALVEAELRHIVLAVAAALTIAVAATHLIPITSRTVVSVSAGISFAMILLLGTSLATWTTGVGYAIAYGYLTLYLKRWPWYTGAFNVGVYVLTTAGSALMYEAIGGGSNSLLLSAQNAIALLLAGAAYFCINTGLVAILVSLRWEQDPWYTWVSMFEEVGAEYITLILMAILMAVVYNYRWWAIFLMILPFIIVYHSLKTSQELRVQTIEAVQALADVVDNRDPYTFEHSRRIAEYAEGTARELGLPEEEIEVISLSARVHDLGKVGIRDDVLYKPEKLTEEEWQSMQQHVRIGAEIVERFPRYKEGRDIIFYHHERYDGDGYLAGLSRDDIPVGARIIAVADAYDAMTTDRPYRDALSHEVAIDELKRHSGSQFDPVVVGAFLKYLDKAGAAARQPEVVPAGQPL